jgi:hypothetical protein
MAISPRFRDGEIVHNRFANEDGKVLGSYDKEGVCMYAVSVLYIPPPREHAPLFFRLGRRLSGAFR